MIFWFQRLQLDLRKYLYKYEIVYRNKLNNKSYRDLQSKLIDDDIHLDIHHNALNIPKIDHKLKILLPKIEQTF